MSESNRLTDFQTFEILFARFYKDLEEYQKIAGTDKDEEWLLLAGLSKTYDSILQMEDFGLYVPESQIDYVEEEIKNIKRCKLEYL